ncbi:hypothetical protein UREG_01908 [Uncinocarpus reesii 1704]|uniref:Caleosin domain-containing protein n=1 Tax=Uncinocarpus reesii (strain UAMH 1704) TaxID=336963 RepID=C4JJV1_UNCRE|nr:uncharacterized protein UREG_01908 [Uncinocarpus reesii 1704]EEP77059.1 hypothetical protein UREG_01908 [Uncinocarpus reesii 1704]
MDTKPISQPHRAVETSRASYSEALESAYIPTSVSSVPVTRERKPFRLSRNEKQLPDPGTARVNIAASRESPRGTTANDWAARHSNQTVLQQHCNFFDFDGDGVIYPSDTFRGFWKLGFGFLLSLLAVFIVHGNFSYPTVNSWLPDPFFRIYIANIHKCKHGSDTGVYDTEGRFIPQKFEDIFSKYADGNDSMSLWQLAYALKGQRLIADPIGWFGAFFEWLATYILLWPEDGKLKKEDIRGVYDGSVFHAIASRRAAK